jgi:Na+/H+ antiporter NhaD/arsenite permease-like protein
MQPTLTQAPAIVAALPPTVAHTLSLFWAMPFVGLLLCITLFPILAERVWHRRMGLIVLGWSGLLLGAQAVFLGSGPAMATLWHALLQDYLPFVSLLVALYTAGGGILLIGGPGGTPLGNTTLLALGMVCAGVMGTTGAAMVFIHPLLNANAHRRRRFHIVVFFIILVANAGGASSPLGDPPLFLGFLHGVPFFWPLRALLAPLLVLAYPLLVTFYVIDRVLLKNEPPPPPAKRLRLRGGGNLLLLAGVIVAVFLQGAWHLAEIDLFGESVGAERLLGMAIYVGVIGTSLRITPRAVRAGNLFSWAPMAEVAKLFAAIFITVSPVLAMLEAGPNGPLAPLLRLAQNEAGAPSPIAYFWLSGLLASFLDNAPTYLVFFQQAGGQGLALSQQPNGALRALTAGAVFFGGLTYIGNAPNMMVRAIASHRGVRMPGFFVYLAYAAALLLPIFVLQTWIFFRA